MDRFCAKQSVGILTRTIVPSPVVRWLLHARVRHRRWNDVVFVGSDFLKVYNIGTGGHLHHIATKDNFDAQIRAARVFDIEEEPLGEDLLLKEEDGSPAGKGGVPPQLIVLTLDCNDLVFLYMAQDEDGSARFVHQSCPMPSFDRTLFQPGEYLAVDPFSRALAVAANEREVIIYSVKTREHISREIAAQLDSWCPVSAQRARQVEGVIQHMEFLIPPSDDHDHVILLLIVADQRKTKAIWIDWYYSSDLHEAQIHPPQPLGSTPSVSSLLIPLRNTAFMTINGSEVQRWKDLVSGSVTGTTLNPLVGEPRNPGNSPRHPVWTTWCRPRRSSVARQEKDHIYLAREDGLVCLLEAKADGKVVSSSAGNLDCHVGTAFASLGDYSDPDILAVAGEMSSGRVVSIGHWPTRTRLIDLNWNETMDPVLTETIPNWASATDMVASTLPHSRSRSARTTDSIFVTSGRAPYGTITEIRRGLETRLSATGVVEGLRNATGIWSLPVVSFNSTFVLITSPAGSRLFRITHSSLDIEIDEIDGERASALDMEHHTLILAATPDERIVHVTERSVCITASLTRNFEDTSRVDCLDGHTIIAAAVNTRQSTVLLLERKDRDFLLRCVDYASVERSAGAASNMDCIGPETIKPLKSEGLALAETWHKAGTIAVVATVDGTLRFFLVAKQPFAIREIHQTKLHDTDDLQSACDSLVLLRQAFSSQILAVCGLRDGTLCSVLLEVDDQGHVSAGEIRTLRFGHNAVKLVPVPDCEDSAFAMTGADFCKVSWTGDDAGPLAIHNIWLSDKARPELDQTSIIACTRVPHSDSLAIPQLAGSLMLVSGDEFMIGCLDSFPTTVPRQISVSGTPSRLLYVEQQRCLVCASMHSGIRQFPTPSSRPEERRQVWPVIDFVPTRSSRPSFSHDMQPGERVYALLEWTYTLHHDDHAKLYSFILVGGSYHSRNNSHKGKVTFLQPTIRTSGRNWEVVDIKEGTCTTFDAPVYALAKYDDLTYAVCYGKHVQLFRFLDSRWVPLCEPLQLASAGVYLTAAEPLLYVSTYSDSHVTLQLEPCDVEDEDDYPYTLVLVRSSPRADTGLSHLIVTQGRCDHATENDIALMSTQNGKVVGLSSIAPDNEPRTHSQAADILFEAHLPRSLTRMRRCRVRPAWREAPPSGVIADDIVGCAADGALVGVALLDEKLWGRLFWLQRLCEWDKTLSPHSYESPLYEAAEDGFRRDERALPVGLSKVNGSCTEIVLATSNSRLNDKHIDGDVLARILENGGADELRRVIENVAKKDDRVGAWVREHLDEELGAVDEIISTLQRLLHCWL